MKFIQVLLFMLLAALCGRAELRFPQKCFASINGNEYFFVEETSTHNYGVYINKECLIPVEFQNITFTGKAFIAETTSKNYIFDMSGKKIYSSDNPIKYWREYNCFLSNKDDKTKELIGVDGSIISYTHSDLVCVADELFGQVRTSDGKDAYGREGVLCLQI